MYSLLLFGANFLSFQTTVLAYATIKFMIITVAHCLEKTMIKLWKEKDRGERNFLISCFLFT